MTKTVRFKMLSSILSFIFALGIFTVVAFAWFALSDESTVGNVPLNIVGDEGYRMDAFMEYYDDALDIWRQVNNDIILQYMVPEQEYVFRITITATTDNVSVNMIVKGFSSELAYDGIDEDDFLYVNRQGERQLLNPDYYYYSDEAEDYVPLILIEEAMQIHVIKTVLDGTEEEVDEYFLLSEYFVRQQSIPAAKSFIVTFGIFFTTFGDILEDSDNCFQFQKFQIQSIWITSNN